MDKIKKFILAYLVASVGLTKEAATEKLEAIENGEAPDETIAEVMGLFKAKVDDLKRTNFDQGHQKAAKEVKFAFEKDLKEKYGVSSDKIGLELIAEIVAAQTGSTGKGSDDDVKKHPLFLKLEADSKKALAETEMNHKAAFKKLEESIATSALLKEVSAIGIAEFEKLNPILSQDATKASKQKALVAKQLEGRSFQKVGNDFLILKEDGSRLEDEHGNPVRLSNLVKEISDDLGFDYKVASERSSSAGGEGKGSEGEGGKKYTGKMPANQDEFHAILFDATLGAEEKGEVQAYWKEKQSSII